MKVDRRYETEGLLGASVGKNACVGDERVGRVTRKYLRVDMQVAGIHMVQA